MSGMLIQCQDVWKSYGSQAALKGLNLQMESGKIVGLLGPNGAGKSTTMNLMTGCLAPTAGTITIDGLDLYKNAQQAKGKLGYLPELPPVYPDMTVDEYLRFVGQARKLKGSALQARVNTVTTQTQLQDVRRRLIKTLSKGYRQRVGIAQALLGNPKVIILDEPTVGLDPIQIIEIRDLIKELGQTHTVIFSSHILSEVQTICDQIIMIAKGKLVAFDTPENLEQHLLTPNEVILTTDTPASEVRTLLEGISNITELSLEEPDSGLVTARIKTDLSDVYQISRAVFSAFAASGNTLLELAVKKANLEDIFLELADNDAAAPELPVVEGEPVESEVPEE